MQRNSPKPTRITAKTSHGQRKQLRETHRHGKKPGGRGRVAGREGINDGQKRKRTRRRNTDALVAKPCGGKGIFNFPSRKRAIGVNRKRIRGEKNPRRKDHLVDKSAGLVASLFARREEIERGKKECKEVASSRAEREGAAAGWRNSIRSREKGSRIMPWGGGFEDERKLPIHTRIDCVWCGKKGIIYRTSEIEPEERCSRREGGSLCVALGCGGPSPCKPMREKKGGGVSGKKS